MSVVYGVGTVEYEILSLRRARRIRKRSLYTEERDATVFLLNAIILARQNCAGDDLGSAQRLPLRSALGRALGDRCSPMARRSTAGSAAAGGPAGSAAVIVQGARSTWSRERRRDGSSKRIEIRLIQLNFNCGANDSGVFGEPILWAAQALSCGGTPSLSIG